MIGKMGPKSACDRLAAGLRSQAAARLIPFGLINQLKMAAKDFAHRMVPGVARASWIKPSLILFTAGLWCLPMRGATDTNTCRIRDAATAAGFHSMGYKPKHRQGTPGALPEACAHPDAIGGNVPRSAAASLINGPKIEAAPTPPPPPHPETSCRCFFSPPRSFLPGF